ncbi:MAG: NADH-quinone oxidoreductase subunit N, partial [Planctomycetales bacterium]
MTIGSDDDPEPELLGALLVVLSGMMLVSVATDLILLFLGLELISIPTYILLFLGRRNAAAEEATLKYFFLGILSSTLMLYGFSFLYGVTGSLRLDQIQASWLVAPSSALAAPILIPVALVLILAGLCFKMAVVPFHFYAPDVYQGTTNMNAGLLAIIPKIAGLVALIRIATSILPEIALYGWQVLFVLSILSMTIGNVVALWQNNIRRMLAYSSIAHAGTMLIGLAVWMTPSSEVPMSVGRSGLAATMMYLCVYVAAGVGTFATLVYLGRAAGSTSMDDTGSIDTLDQLAGLGRTNRVAALALAVFMFSFTGIPPLAGFWGKLEIFTSALSVPQSAPCHNWFVLLAIIGAINAAI